MKTPVKLSFIALPLLVIGAVSWHLQHPPQVTPGEASCQSPAHSQPLDPEASSSSPAAGGGCDGSLPRQRDRSTGTLVTDLRLVQFDGERVHWTMKAPSARNDNEERILIREPDLTIHKKDGQLSTLTAAEGLVDSRSHAMVFTGTVQVNSGAEHLTTEVLRFDPNEKRLYTDQPFVLVNEEMQMEGVGLTLYQETQKMVVPRRVKVRYTTTQEGACREKTGFQPRRT